MQGVLVAQRFLPSVTFLRNAFTVIFPSLPKFATKDLCTHSRIPPKLLLTPPPKISRIPQSVGKIGKFQKNGKNCWSIWQHVPIVPTMTGALHREAVRLLTCLDSEKIVVPYKHAPPPQRNAVMRVNFSFIITAFVALSLISGTVGCSVTGPWYKPTSYAFSNPFSRDRSGGASPASFWSDTSATELPSLASQPNLGTPPGGYTGATSLANRSAGASSTPPAHWGAENPMASPGFSNVHGGFTHPEPSQHFSYTPPPSAHFGQHTPHTVAQGQNQFAFQPQESFHQMQHQTVPPHMAQPHMGQPHMAQPHMIAPQHPPMGNMPGQHGGWGEQPNHTWQPPPSAWDQQPMQHHPGGVPQHGGFGVPPAGFGQEQMPPPTFHHDQSFGMPAQQQHHAAPPSHFWH